MMAWLRTMMSFITLLTQSSGEYRDAISAGRNSNTCSNLFILIRESTLPTRLLINSEANPQPCISLKGSLLFNTSSTICDWIIFLGGSVWVNLRTLIGSFVLIEIIPDQKWDWTEQHRWAVLQRCNPLDTKSSSWRSNSIPKNRKIITRPQIWKCTSVLDSVGL